MIRKALFAAAILLAPTLAFAQTPAADAARAAQAAADAAWPKTGPTPPLPVAETLPKMFKVILIGDSTMQTNSGWGGAFCAYHVNFSITCVNMAKGGRSTSNYRAERSWEVAQYEMKSGGFADTYVLIQFGHNDQPGKAGRSTDIVTEYPANLRRYVEEIRAAGAKPVLVTPIVRRQFENGKLVNDLEPWAEATRKIAAEMKVPLVDLNRASFDAVQAMGAAESTRFAQKPPSAQVLAAARTGTTIAGSTGAAPMVPVPQDAASVEPQGDPKLSFDYTHLGKEGAEFFAVQVTTELARVVPELRRGLIK
jgi:lysophospholipase L1-like esterase